MDLNRILEQFDITPDSGQQFIYNEGKFTSFLIKTPKKYLLEPEVELIFKENPLTLEYFRLRPLKILQICNLPLILEQNQEFFRSSDITMLDDHSIIYYLKGWQKIDKEEVEKCISYFIDFVFEFLQNLNNQVKKQTTDRNLKKSSTIPGFFQHPDSIRPEDKGYFREVTQRIYEKITKKQVSNEFQPFFITKRKNHENRYFYEAYFWKNDSLVALNSKKMDLADDKAILEEFYGELSKVDNSSLESPRFSDSSNERGARPNGGFFSFNILK